MPAVVSRRYRYDVDFDTRQFGKHKGLVVRGSQRVTTNSVPAAFFGVIGILLSPAGLAATSSTSNFLQALTECFAEFRFTKLAITAMPLSGTNQPGELAIGYLPDAGAYDLGATTYDNNGIGFAKVASTPASLIGPASMPLTNDITEWLSDDWCKTVKRGARAATGADSTNILFARQEDQGVLVVGAYNPSITTLYIDYMVEYELEFKTLQTNVLVDNIGLYTEGRPQPPTSSPEEKKDDSLDTEWHVDPLSVKAEALPQPAKAERAPCVTGYARNLGIRGYMGI